jgi:hypothetical protein
MRTSLAMLFAASAGLTVPMTSASLQPALAQQVDRYTVYCADERIEVSIWDLEQMIVRRGTPVCQFASYTSYGDALTFAQKNFGGEGKSCSC